MSAADNLEQEVGANKDYMAPLFGENFKSHTVQEIPPEYIVNDPSKEHIELMRQCVQGIESAFVKESPVIGYAVTESATEKERITPITTKDLDAILAERGSRYGDFRGHSDISQELKEVMHATENWERLNSSQKESLEMIAHKIGRILNGDPNYEDSWADIAGYAELVAKQLRGIDI